MKQEMIYRMRRKVKHFLPFYLFTFLFFLSSCNLFIEEVEDENGNKAVPQHTGVGYDKPVTVEESGCEVTYQYKNNVRRVEGDALRYVKYVEYDETSSLIEIHYDANTPSSMLPVPGEILVSTHIETFPMGVNHLLQNRTFEDGVWKYLGTLALLQDTYEVLNIDGQLTVEEETYEVIAEEPEDSVQGTRAEDPKDDGWIGVDRAKVRFKDGFELQVGLGDVSFETPYGVAVNLVMNPKDNYLRLKTAFDFTGFSLSNMKFNYINEVEQKMDMKVEGQLNFSKELFHFKPVKGKPILIGPVVLVFFVDLIGTVGIDVTGGLRITKWSCIEKTYKVDLNSVSMKLTKTEEKRNEPLTIQSAIFTGKAGVTVDIPIGLGIYGKILSVKLKPSVWAGVEASSPEFVKSDKNIFDIKDNSGLDFKATLDLKLGVDLDVSMSNIFGFDFFKETKDIKAAMKKVKNAADKDQKYQEMANKQIDRFSKQQDLEHNYGDIINTNYNSYLPIGTFTLFHKFYTWYPKLKDSSFKIEHIMEDQHSQMSFVGQYQIENQGFFALMGKHYVPALRITNGKDQHVGTIFPEEGGVNAELDRNETYHFRIPTIEDNKTYIATPCYFPHPVSEGDPEAMDKGLPFCATTPSVNINDVKVTALNIRHSSDGYFFDSQGNSYNYELVYHVDTYTSVKGYSNMYYWSILENRSGERMDSNTKQVEKKDGTYIYHWTISVLTNKLPKSRLLEFKCSLQTLEGVRKTGNTYSIMLHSQGNYDILDDGTGFSLDNIPIDKITNEELEQE